MSKRILTAAPAVLLGAALTACDFADAEITNPNQVPDATATQLFTSIQVNSFFASETQHVRLATLWLQQMAGTDRQFATYDIYSFSEGDGDEAFTLAYIEGGLVAIEQARTRIDEVGCRVCSGILDVHEAYMIGTAASIYGDVPYSEAVDPEIEDPALDEQLAVYAAMLALLDDAIADLQSGEEGGGAEFLNADMNFGGDAGAWLAVAHSLKARFHMHLAETDPSNYALALAEARQGIASPAGNWAAIHSDAGTEANAWWQFMRDRSGYISAGAFMVGLLNGGTPTDFGDDDPRLEIYFSPTDDDPPAFIGSPPGNPQGDLGPESAQLNTGPNGAGAAAYDQPILSCAETQFIAAEAALAGGNAAEAQTALAAGIACQEQKFGVDIADAPTGLSGNALLAAIIEQKYLANFLNVEIWNDYKRTCLPAIETYQGQPIPARLFYPAQERQTNANIPPPDEQPTRNDNDPNGCS